MRDDCWPNSAHHAVLIVHIADMDCLHCPDGRGVCPQCGKPQCPCPKLEGGEGGFGAQLLPPPSDDDTGFWAEAEAEAEAAALAAAGGRADGSHRRLLPGEEAGAAAR
eukprot:SAG22_NODE_2334_length_2704_cov_1.163532_4_plen_108_part_00